MMRALMIAASLTGLLIASSDLAASGNASRGQELAGQVCQSCHGINGDMALAPDYPILAGQHRDYLVFALKAYRSGDREHVVMSSFARDLTDQNIEDLAAWFSRQDGLVELKIR